MNVQKLLVSGNTLAKRVFCGIFTLEAARKQILPFRAHFFPNGGYFGDFGLQLSWACIGKSMYSYSSRFVALAKF